MSMTKVDWNLHSLLFNVESQCKFLRLFIAVYDSIDFEHAHPISHIVYREGTDDIPERPKKARRTYQAMLRAESMADTDTEDEPAAMYTRLRERVVRVLDDGHPNEIALCVVLVLYQTTVFQEMACQHTEAGLARLFFHAFDAYTTQMVCGVVKCKPKVRSSDGTSAQDSAVVCAAQVPSAYMPILKTYFHTLVTCHRVCMI